MENWSFPLWTCTIYRNIILLILRVEQRNVALSIYQQAFREIYKYTGYSFDNIERVNRRMCNCFFKAFVKDAADTLKRKSKNNNDKCGIKKTRLSANWAVCFCWEIFQYLFCVIWRMTRFMAYSIHGQISCRQKIELGILGPSGIKPSCSVYSPACSEYAGTNSSFGRNYWEKYGPFVLFAITVNKSVAFIFLITCFLQLNYELMTCK